VFEVEILLNSQFSPIGFLFPCFMDVNAQGLLVKSNQRQINFCDTDNPPIA